MPRNRTQSHITVLEKCCKPDAEMVARKEALTKSVGARLGARLRDNLAQKDAAPLADFVVPYGLEKSISLLSR